jgi:hypothetical protein
MKIYITYNGKQDKLQSSYGHPKIAIKIPLLAMKNCPFVLNLRE